MKNVNYPTLLIVLSFVLSNSLLAQKPDKYEQKDFEGEAIPFKDFNFKLAVIQVLMYEEKLIKPKFDLYEFVYLYEERKIDIDKEGYDLIPEVTQYFKDLKIDKKLASQVTEIYQDGGNEIYGHLLRFWDGSDDTFNIQSADDIEHFPNLEKATLFYEDQPVIKHAFIRKGIETKYL